MASVSHMKSTFLQHCRQTSVKAIPRLLRTRSRLMRLIWAVGIICFLAMAVYQASILIQAYFKYNSLTSLQESPARISNTGQTSLEVPDATFCNLNPFANDFWEVPGIPPMDDYVEMVRKWRDCQECKENYNATFTTFLTALDSTMGYFTHIGGFNTRRIGHSVDSFISSCRLWRQIGLQSVLVPCDGNALIEFHQDPMLYNCYTLRIPASDSNNDMFTGFVIIFHLDDYGNNDNLNTLRPLYHIGYMNGILFTLQERDHPPVIMTNRMFIQSGLFSDQKIRIQRHKRLVAPYGSCLENAASKNEYSENGTYSRTACFFKCIDTKIRKECDCIDLSTVLNMHGDIHNMSCIYTNNGLEIALQKFECALKAKSAYADYCMKRCPLPCEEQMFQSQVSGQSV